MDQVPLATTASPKMSHRHAPAVGATCYNCATSLQGRWCHACGQAANDYHRAATHLVWEAFEGFFHADSRLWHTLPRLLVRPAALTRDYLAGRRASQVPPMRIFFIVLLLVFFVGEALTRHTDFHVIKMDPGDDVAKLRVSIYPAWDQALTDWTRAHVSRAIAHPDALLSAMTDWAHDFAFLSLPIFGLILAAIFVFRRGFVLFDHMIFSMHSLSFLGILLLVTMILDRMVGDSAWLLLWLVPVHQFFHLRGVYGTGVFGTLVRLGVLAFAASIAFSLITFALVIVAMAALKA